ncbi:MAG: serine/threonine-protein kinase, partial [Methanobacteriota archaeon]
SLLLAFNYLLVLIMLGWSEIRTVRGWGSGQISPAVIFGLLVVLILLHILISTPLFQDGHRARLMGTALTATSVFAGGMLIFSSQIATLLRTNHSAPIVVYVLLILSLVYGLLLVVRKDHSLKHPSPGSLGMSEFPVSLASRYEEVRFLASGGVGSIWYARYASGEEVAVKIPSRSDEQTGSSFLQEIQVWRELENEHIVRIYSANILPVPYMEMEYLPVSLRSTPVPVPVSEALRIITGIASGLAYAHSRGIAHCDVKPGNILISPEGTSKITDWGISRQENSRWSVSGFSTRYAAPEQRGPSPECGPEADVYQTGLLLSLLLIGRAEMPSGTEAIFGEEEGSTLLRIIRRCLAENPGDRYPDCTGLLYDLQRIPGNRSGR